MVPGFPQPELPLEVFVIIIDFLWEDKQTLKTCALVNRPWLHFTRLHLLRDLKIDLSTSVGQSRIALLADGSMVHCTYIQTLHIAIENYRQYSSVSHETCSRILWNLPRLHTLLLEELVIAESNISPDNPLYASHSINTLKLLFNDFQPEDSNLDVLTLFSHIKHLQVDSDDAEWLDDIWPDEEDLARIQPAHHLRISETLTLNLTSPGISTLRKLLQPSMTTTNALQFHFCPMNAHGPIDGRSVPEEFLTKSYWSIFNMSQCHALETMTLSIDGVFREDEAPEVFSLLLQNVPVTIRKLVLELEESSFDSGSGWFALDLGKLETLLSRFTHLEVLTFSVADCYRDGLLEAFIIKGLPKLHRQGLLEFETRPRQEFIWSIH